MTVDEVHSGYEFEEGMFSRVRSWIDVAPWIRLARVARILASPAHVGLVSLALAVSMLLGWLLVGSAPPLVTIFDGESTGWLDWGAMRDPSTFKFCLAALLLIPGWIVVGQVVGRAGASLVAQNRLPEISVSLAIVRKRFWLSILLPLIPILCIFGFAILLFLLRIPSLVLPFGWLSAVTGVMAVGISLPIGILGFGALFAIPLGLIAMVSEPDPDPIDSLSRGYEYLYRRPFSLAWYFVVAGGMVWLAKYLILGIAGTSEIALAIASRLIRIDETMVQSGQVTIMVIVCAWLATLAMGLTGGVYLLLRRDAGGQEVEDFWSPPQESDPPLPELPSEAYQS